MARQLSALLLETTSTDKMPLPPEIESSIEHSSSSSRKPNIGQNTSVAADHRILRTASTTIAYVAPVTAALLPDFQQPRSPTAASRPISRYPTLQAGITLSRVFNKSKQSLNASPRSGTESTVLPYHQAGRVDRVSVTEADYRLPTKASGRSLQGQLETHHLIMSPCGTQSKNPLRPEALRCSQNSKQPEAGIAGTEASSDNWCPSLKRLVNLRNSSDEFSQHTWLNQGLPHLKVTAVDSPRRGNAQYRIPVSGHTEAAPPVWRQTNDAAHAATSAPNYSNRSVSHRRGQANASRENDLDQPPIPYSHPIFKENGHLSCRHPNARPHNEGLPPLTASIDSALTNNQHSPRRACSPPAAKTALQELAEEASRRLPDFTTSPAPPPPSETLEPRLDEASLLPRGLHHRWRAIHIGTARCDVCDRLGHATLARCETCSWQVCEACCCAAEADDGSRERDPGARQRRYFGSGPASAAAVWYFVDQSHAMGTEFDWIKPTAAKGLRRARKMLTRRVARG
jgi:hypothetical protein